MNKITEVEVINKMLEVIPETEEILISSLKDLKTSVEYSAPELAYLRWQTFEEILNDNVPNPTSDWELQLVKIWNNEDD